MHNRFAFPSLQVALMDLVPSDKALGLATPVWDEYAKIINSADRHAGGKKVHIGTLLKIEKALKICNI